MTLLRFLATLLLLTVSAGAGALGILVAAQAGTVTGRLWAIAVLLAVVALLAVTGCFIGVLRRRRKTLVKLGLLYATASAATWWACSQLSPIPPAEGGAEFSWSWGGDHRVPDPADLIPEPDQIRIGTWLMPYFDQTVTSDVAVQLGRVFGEFYSAMEREDAFVSAPSALPESYRSWLGLSARGGPVFTYSDPADEAGLPARAILFFHGTPGNLKAGAWLWSAALTGRPITLVAATAGAGDWTGELGDLALDEAVARCDSDPAIRSDSMVLVGLGKGSEGVLKAAAQYPDRVSDVVLISPDIPSDRMRSQEVRDPLVGKRVLILHGQDDLRKPLSEVSEDTRWLSENGVWIWLTKLAGDHHAFWTNGSAATAEVVAWVDQG